MIKPGDIVRRRRTGGHKSITSVFSNRSEVGLVVKVIHDPGAITQYAVSFPSSSLPLWFMSYELEKAQKHAGTWSHNV